MFAALPRLSQTVRPLPLCETLAALSLGALPMAWCGMAVALDTAGDGLVLRLDRSLSMARILAGAQPDSPQPAPAPGRVPPPAARKRGVGEPDAALQPEMLLLAVSINGQVLAGAVRAEQWPGGALLLPVQAWTEARLAPLAQVAAFRDGTPAYPLGAAQGATWRLNRQNLSLDIQAPASAFVSSQLGGQDDLAAPPPRPGLGAMFNYDASVSRGGSGGPVTVGATLEAVAFSRLGNVVVSALLQDDGTQRTVARLDTFWRYDMPERLETLVVGDAVGVGGGWSRPVRFAGVRWGRDFGMRPGFVTMPQIALAGEAALPSTVEVLVNNARRISQSVQPGPFELTNVPVVTGAGEINLVVRDLLGRETVVRQNYYASTRLLAPGLDDFSIEAGWLRTGYGQDSRYGDGFASGTWRQGLTMELTGEARMELAAKRRAAGLELAGLLGQWGVARMALAASSGSAQGVDERGQMLQMGIERSTRDGGGALQYERAGKGFAPFGEGTGPAAPGERPRQRLLAVIGGSVWGNATAGASYVQQTRWDGDQLRLFGVSLSVPLGERSSVSMTLSKRLGGSGAPSASIIWHLPLESGIYTSTRVERSAGGQMAVTASAARSAPAGPGLGWRVDASSRETQRARAGLQYNTSQAEFALDGATDALGHMATRAGARGTEGWLSGVPFLPRPVGKGSFAVVQVDGVAGVAVKRSNQVVAETDARGLAFVPGLLPWQKNLIEIDPESLPMDVEFGALQQEITPFASSGQVLKFALRRTRQALVVLHQMDGKPVPAGTRVRLLPDGPEFIAGRRGEVWLTDLAEARQLLEAGWPGGGCRLELLVPPNGPDGNPPKIGPLTCGKERP